MDQIFEHEPLEGQDSVRLLRILPGEGAEPVCCNCVHISLADANQEPFEAVSYTWGDPTKSHLIIINGWQFLTTRNAHDVLQSMRCKDRVRSIWIDAICIHQDDADEKKHQLPLMKGIYSSATQVYAWLGEASADSDLALILLHELRVLYREYTRELGDPVPPYPVGLWGISVEDVLQFTCTTLHSPRWRALREFLKRPWFRRIWVYQEVVLARRIQMVCGPLSVDFQDFAPVIHWLLYNETSTILHYKDDPKERGVIGRPRAGFMHLSRMHETRYNAIHKNQLLTLEDHLCEPVYWEATEPRDMIYAVLGIVAEGNDPELKPDYKKSVVDVFVAATESTIITRGSLRILCCAGVGQRLQISNLPTWVPDYTGFRPFPAIGMMGEKSLYTKNLPQMSVTFQGKKMTVRGTRVGVVDCMGRVNDLAGVKDDWNGRNRELFKLENSLAALGGSVPGMLWRTLIQNDSERTGILFPAGFESWKRLTEYMCCRKFGWRYLKSVYRLLWFREKFGEAVRYSESMFWKTIYNRLAKVSTYGLAIVPIHTEVGDVVCILFGLSVPIILRENAPSGDGQQSFSVVGGCYVDGLLYVHPEELVQEDIVLT